ncbi:MAG: DUF4476 domain-containing protein [Bacteroidota bacterium]
MIKPAFTLFMLALLFGACQGNIHGEYGGKFESRNESTTTITVNGEKVREERSTSTTGSALEGEFNLDLGQPKGDIRQPPPFPARIACDAALSVDRFERLKSELLQVNSDREKLLFMKENYPETCFLSAQVRDVAAMFTLDKYRLQFAQSFYGHTQDRMNYYKVRNVMEFSDSRKQLDEFVSEW